MHAPALLVAHMHACVRTHARCILLTHHALLIFSYLPPAAAAPQGGLAGGAPSGADAGRLGLPDI